MINNKTKLFISIGTKPGGTGTFIYNNLFKKKNINAIYKSFKIENLNDLIKSIRTLKIDGFSVSMPYKSKIIPFLDNLDHTSKLINSVNTVLYKHGKLSGYNSDVYGIKAALTKYKIPRNSKILIVGLGGTAASALFVSSKLFKQENIFITNRSKKKIKFLKKITEFHYLDKIEIKKNQYSLDVIINCTPIGMDHQKNKLPVTINLVKKASFIIDFVNKPVNTKLISEAKRLKKNYVSGDYISINQLLRQFFIYKGIKIDYKQIQSIYNLYEKIK